jgi:predicted RNA-binding protein with PIN domain
MAIRIIVDGYNFIGAQKGLHGNIEGRREELIRQLGRYRAARGYEITVVFDAWDSGWPSEHSEYKEGIRVVFSRHGEKADEVICRMARKLGASALVVSSDNEVARCVEQAGGVAVRVMEFNRKLQEAGRTGGMEALEKEEPESGRPAVKKGNPRKLSKKERKKKMRLDRL